MRLQGTIQSLIRIIFKKDNKLITVVPNKTINYSDDRTVELPPSILDGTLASENSTTEFTNKTITHSTNNISASLLTSGTLPDDRMSASSVTQHASTVPHQSLSGAGTNSHEDIDTHIGNVTTNPHVVTKTNVSLGNVDDVQQTPLSYLDTDATLSGNLDTKIPSQKAVLGAITTESFTLSNKFISGADNTITNIVDDNFVDSPAIDWSKLAAGTTNRLIKTNTSTGLPEVIAAPSTGEFLIWNDPDYDWDVPAGAGNVVGPATSADTSIVLWSGLNQKLIKSCGVTIDNDGNISTDGFFQTATTSGDGIICNTTGQTAKGRLFHLPNGICLTDNLYLGAAWYLDDASKPSGLLVLDTLYNGIKFHTTTTGAGAKSLLSPFGINITTGATTIGTPASFGSTTNFDDTVTFSSTPTFNSASAWNVLTTGGSKQLSSITATGSGSAVLNSQPDITTPTIHGGSIYVNQTLTNNGTISGGVLNNVTLYNTVFGTGTTITNNHTIYGGTFENNTIDSPVFYTNLTGSISSGQTALNYFFPSLCNMINCTITNKNGWKYSKIGNIVTFSGYIRVTVYNYAPSQYEVDMDWIPGMTPFTSPYQAYGIMPAKSGIGRAVISSVSGTTRIRVQFNTYGISEHYLVGQLQIQ